MGNVLSVSMVKNENDIIETFCRHTLTMVDGMIILDDNSTDNTTDIIGKLIGEGHNIILHQREKAYGYYQDIETTALVKEAVFEHNADWILPLDADELLCTTDGADMRALIDTLDSDKVYRSMWRTYIYPGEYESFHAKNYNQYRNPVFEREISAKLILSKKILFDYGYTLSMGNHNAIPSPQSPKLDTIILPNVVHRHYPVRSIRQITTKVLIGWLNFLCMDENMQKKAFHWSEMYASIKNGSSLTPEQVRKFSCQYGLPSTPQRDKNISSGDFLVDDPNCHLLTYDNNHAVSSVNVLKNLLEYVEYLIGQMNETDSNIQ